MHYAPMPFAVPLGCLNSLSQVIPNFLLSLFPHLSVPKQMSKKKRKKKKSISSYPYFPALSLFSFLSASQTSTKKKKKKSLKLSLISLSFLGVSSSLIPAASCPTHLMPWPVHHPLVLLSSVCRLAIILAFWPYLIPAPSSLCPSLGSTVFHMPLTHAKFSLHDHAWPCPVLSNRPPTCPIFASSTEAYRLVGPETYQLLLIIIGPAFSCLLSHLLSFVSHFSSLISLSLFLFLFLSCLVIIGSHTQPRCMSPPSSTYILL